MEFALNTPLDVFNDFESSLLNQFHTLAVAILAQEARSTNDEIHAVHTAFHSLLRIVHVASYVCEDLGLENM